MTTLALYIFIFLTASLGACFGSFLNVVIWRVPEKMSLLTPPSHCPKCGARVRWYDNIPILSWFILGAKCRDCREPISGRYPLVEGISFALALTLAIAFILGGWTGDPAQWLFWDGYSEHLSAWCATLNVDSSNDVSGGELSSLSIVAQSYVVDMFFRALFATTLLVTLFTATLDSILALGFVEYDRCASPCSLVIATLIASVLSILTVIWLGSEYTTSVSSDRILAALKSMFCGAVAPVLICKWLPLRERFETIALGACGGLWFTPILSLTVVAIALALALGLRKRLSRNYFGLLVFFSIFVYFIVETIFVFV